MNRIALVEDHERLAELVRPALAAAGSEADSSSRLQIVNIRALGHALREATLAP